MYYKPLSIVLLFLSFCSFSQTINDLNKIYSPIKIIQKNTRNPIISNNTDFVYNYCDLDNDGFETIDLIPILDDIQVAVASDLEISNPKLLIGTSDLKIIQIDDVLQTPITTIICDLPGPTYDVAINSDKELFTTNFSFTHQIDESTCNLSTILNQGGNSLSFDTQNNLYFNNLSLISSAVYRLDAGLSSTPYIWHDFNQGQAGGDFVVLGNYMYISWKTPSGSDILFKVTIDGDINYVSHEELGSLKSNTYGLASEQGVLYGVTPSELYRIELSTSPPTFETILENDDTYGNWWGSAGFSEAM